MSNWKPRKDFPAHKVFKRRPDGQAGFSHVKWERTHPEKDLLGSKT